LGALLLGAFCLAPVQGLSASQKRALVLIDPAHGGEDTGVIVDRVREKELTLALALRLQQEAQKAGNIEILLTRTADRTLSVPERLKAAEARRPECLLSLHVNAGFGKKASGYEVYFPGFRSQPGGGPEAAAILKDMEKTRSLNDSVRLAQQVQAALEKIFPRQGRGLREAPSPLLDAVTVAGLVVEVGFATQTEDRKRIMQEETQRALARALLKGLQDYIQKAP
jgi:N-acetylmuramoyl-L-alanine amidase